MRIDRATYLMKMAVLTSKRSTCLSRQVGAVTVDLDFKILGTGYNGPPSGIPHCTTCKRTKSGGQFDECYAVHAEINAILQSKNISKIHAIFCTDKPCYWCMTILMNTPCELIVYLRDYPSGREDLWELKNRTLIDFQTYLKQTSSPSTLKHMIQI